jgi:Pyridoxamine 5'-phosphate oxidase
MEPQMEIGGSLDPEPSQPRMFGNAVGSGRLSWQWATEQLTRARNYWIATTRPDGRPHSRPVWGVWLDGIFYFSTGSLAAQNLTASPAITVHLESGSEVVIIEGVAETVSDRALVERVVNRYNEKYHWNVDPNHLPGPFYAVRPQIAFGWHFEESEINPESTALGNATRWRFG